MSFPSPSVFLSSIFFLILSLISAIPRSIPVPLSFVHLKLLSIQPLLFTSLDTNSKNSFSCVRRITWKSENFVVNNWANLYLWERSKLEITSSNTKNLLSLLNALTEARKNERPKQLMWLSLKYAIGGVWVSLKKLYSIVIPTSSSFFFSGTNFISSTFSLGFIVV